MIRNKHETRMAIMRRRGVSDETIHAYDDGYNDTLAGEDPLPLPRTKREIKAYERGALTAKRDLGLDLPEVQAIAKRMEERESAP